MKDPSEKVLQAIYTALNGNVTVSGNTLPVYTVIPDSVENGYIYISDYTLSDDSLKDRFWTIGNVQIQIALNKADTGGSVKVLQQYSTEVLNALTPNVNSVLDLTPNFTNTYLYTQNITTISTLFSNDSTIRKVINLTIGVEEN